MSSIVFQNPGLIDLRAVTTMGLNAKPGIDNPIGFFGTGLKFAIATILRLDGTISIYRGTERTTFFTRKEAFRDKEFSFIMMENKEGVTSLGITTELGKTWEAWMAIRELESNVRDEKGRSWLESDRFGVYEADQTTIVVTGAALVEAYAKLDDVFVATPVKGGSNRLQVREQGRTNKTNCYYRGILAANWSKQPLFRYNLMCSMVLTEDRTIKHTWLIDIEVRNFFMTDCKDKEMLAEVLMAPEHCMEAALDFDVDLVPSDEFCEVVDALGAKCNRSAWHFYRRHKKLTNWDELPLDEYNQKLLTQAREFLDNLGFDTFHVSVKVASNLGDGVMGCVFNGQVWIAVRTFELGKKQLISTLLEEFIHKDRGYQDHSYDMQNFLFDTIIGLGARYVTKEPL